MRWPTVLALCLVLAATGGRADEVDERVPAQPGGRLEFDLDRGEGLRPDPGSVTVSSHAADEVRMVADVSGWGASDVSFRIDRNGDTVRIYGRNRGSFSWMFGGPRVNVRIWVPREFSVDVRCNGGAVRIENVTGNLRARTVDAPLEVVSAEGDVRLRASQGSVRVSEVTGNVDIKTAAGDIELSWIRGNVEARTGEGTVDASHVTGDLGLRTESGAIEIRELRGSVDAKTERGRISAGFLGNPAGALETSRGGVEVVIPREAGLELDALSRDGAVEVAEDIALARRGGGDRAAGPINGGGARLRLYTAHGAIRVRGR